MSLMLQRAVMDQLHGRRYEMPFAAVGGAIAGAVGSAFAAGSAAAVSLGAAAGGVMATAAGVISAVGLVATWVGVGLTVVGAVTGNTDLMKIGGYVGLAGGLTGLAVSGINAAFSTATTQVASTATTEAAKQGAQSAAEQGTSAAVQRAVGEAGNQLTQNLSQQAGANLAAQGASQSTGMLSSAGGQAAHLAGSSGANALTAGANLAKEASMSGLQNAAMQGLDDVVAQTANAGNGVFNSLVDVGASFFDNITKYNGVMNIGGEVLKGMAAGSAQDDMMDFRRDQLALRQQQLALQEKQFGYQKMAEERAYQNANTQGRLSLSTRPLTAAERAAQAGKKVRNFAQPITQPAGTR
jgi:hypothetical protein